MGRRTLASDLASDVERVFLNPDEFAEELIYTAVNETGREVVCVVNLMQATLMDRTSHETFDAAIELMCSSDPCTGIPDPGEGDTVLWSGKTWCYLRTVGGCTNTRVLHFTHTTVQHAGHSRPPSM